MEGKGSNNSAGLPFGPSRGISFVATNRQMASEIDNGNERYASMSCTEVDRDKAPTVLRNER